MATDYDVEIALNLTIGSVPVSLTGAVSTIDGDTVYTFDGGIGHATIHLGAFMQAAMEQFGATAELPPEIDLTASITYVAGRLQHRKPQHGEATTNVALAGDFTLTTESHGAVRIVFHANTIQGAAATAPYVLGAAFDFDLPFASLPLLGSIPGFSDLALTSVGFSYASEAAEDKPASFAIPKVTQKPSPLVVADGPDKTAKTYAIDPNSTGHDLLIRSPGFSLTVGITNKATGAVLRNFAIPLGGQSRPHRDLALADPPAPASSGTKDPINWIDLDKTFGPVRLNKIGLAYAQGEATFGLSATLTLAAFSLDMQGLAITFPLPLPGQPAGKTVSFDLAGLALDLRKGALEIGGSFLRVQQDGHQAYFGELAVQAAGFGLKAMGGYTPAVDAAHPASFFLYARLTAPLGGPPFLFITGLAAGFGVHSALMLPTIDSVGNYLLLPGKAPVPAEGAPIGDTVRTVLSQLQAGEVFRYQPGEYWIAVGISFTSFEMIDAFALATVAFGVELQIGLLGSCSMTLPKGAQGMVVGYAEIDIVASYTPSTGLIAVAGKLSPASFLFGGYVHLSGGFAFNIWVSGPDKGDFVVSLGGYHPAFKRPPKYPAVPRLGLQFVLGPLQVTGESYFALTPAMMMCGLALHASWSSHGIRAWLDASIDMLLVWSPFHYEAQAGLSIGVSIDLGLFQLDFHIDALLKVWGPQFGGTAEIDLSVASFVISFGAARVPPPPVGWATFCASFLPKPTERKKPPAPHLMLRAARAHAAGARRTRNIAAAGSDPEQNAVTASVARGLVSTDVQGLDWIVDPDGFWIETRIAVPASRAEWKRVGDTVALPNDLMTWRSGTLQAAPRLSLTLDADSKPFSEKEVWNPKVCIRPMQLSGVAAYHTLALRAIADAAAPADVDAVQVTPVTGPVAAALYAEPIPPAAKQAANEPATVPHALTGFRLTAKQRHPTRVSAMPLRELLFGAGDKSWFADGAPHLDGRYQVAASHPRTDELDIDLSGAHTARLVNNGFVLRALADPWVAAERQAILADLKTARWIGEADAEIDLADFSKTTTLTGWPSVARLGDRPASRAL